jgi:hypothetical protein
VTPERPRLFASALVLVQHLPASAALRGLFRRALKPAFSLAHVTPIKADQNEEKTMTIIDFALLIGALAHFFAALAQLITAIRHRR